MSDEKIKLTTSQELVLSKLEKFVFQSADRFFILKGYAGTGKTTLMHFFIEKLQEKKVNFKLLAPTGRAAKVLTDHTGYEASTIHSMIYSRPRFSQDLSQVNEKINVDKFGQLVLLFEPITLEGEDPNEEVIYIVDESSLISDEPEESVTQAKFGSGRLLQELLDFDTRRKAKFIFVGDPCQLPPIRDIASPALNKRYLENTFGASVQEATLTEIMRQNNSIVFAGNLIRKLWEGAPEKESDYASIKPDYNRNPLWGAKIPLRQFKDIEVHYDLDEMKQLYIANVRDKGYADSVFICSSNKNCHSISLDLRARLGFSGTVQKGDLLMVIQNQRTTGLLNGDMVEVMAVNATAERISPMSYGYQNHLIFREITVKELGAQKERTTILLENVLLDNLGNLGSEQQTRLYLDFIFRMKKKGITENKNPKEFYDAMQNDSHLNALRCTYGYAVTCHKAQGGEWNNTFVQLQRNVTANPTKNKYQWLYTALTRAKNTVHICKDFFIS